MALKLKSANIVSDIERDEINSKQKEIDRQLDELKEKLEFFFYIPEYDRLQMLKGIEEKTEKWFVRARFALEVIFPTGLAVFAIVISLLKV